MTGRSGVVLVALCLAVSAVGPAAAQAGSSGTVIGSPEIDVITSSPEFESGTRATLDLTLSNRGQVNRGGPGEYESRVTTARGVVVEARSGSTPVQIDGGSVAVGNIPTGTRSVPPIQVTVPEDARPGTYRVPVELSYAYTRSVEYDVTGPEYNDFTREETFHVTVRVRDDARFEVVDRTTTAQVGDRGTLSVTVANTGTRPARDASVSAASRSDELRFGTGSADSTAYVGRWAAGERRTLDYTVSMTDDATLRDYTLDLAVDYTDTDGIARTSRTLNVGLRPAAEQSFALTNVSTTLRVGEEGSVSGTVVNEGPGTARNPVVVLTAANPNVVVESPEYALPDLAPGERARVEYDVTVSSAASASVQQLSFRPRYRNDRGDERTGDAAEATTEIAPQRDRFVVGVVDDQIEAGSDRALTVEITNNGDEPLRNVEAKAFVQSPLSSDDDEGIVDELAPGETANVTVALGATGDALTKRYPVSFDFQYETPDGDTEVSQTYTVSVGVTESESGGFPVGIVAVGAVLLGAVAVVGWRRRAE